MQRKGFTLIEILIVVAIIAILASVVLVGLGPAQQSGRDARRLSDLYQIQTALGLYNNKCGGFPGSGAGNCLGNLPGPAPYPAGNVGSVYGAVANALLGASVGVNSMPQDPTTGKSYYYSVPAVAGLQNTYVVSAVLENQNNAAFVNYHGPAMPAQGDAPGACGAAGLYCLTL